MESTRLAASQRLLLVACALSALLVFLAAQWPTLSVDNAARTALLLAAGGVAMLCASVLLEDMLVHPLLQRLRAARARQSLLTQ
jgi:hypothetical protein